MQRAQRLRGAASREQKQMLDNMIQAGQAKELLRERQALQAVANFHSLPHHCPSLAALVDAETVAREVPSASVNIQNLCAAWQKRHEVVGSLRPAPLAHDENYDVKEKVSRCWEAGRCICSGDGRHLSTMWARCRRDLRVTLQDSKLLQEYRSGRVVLLWRGKQLADANDGEVLQEGASTIACVYVPYAKLRPSLPAGSGWQWQSVCEIWS